MKNIRFPALFILLLSFINFLFSQEDLQSKLIGHWEGEAYGRVANFDQNGLQSYNLCKISCEPAFKMTWKEIKNQARFTNLDNNSFTLILGINQYKFNRIDKLPDVCISPDLALKNDPIHNFESLWETFNQHYSYFETRNIDWMTSKEKYRSKLTSQSTELELYIVLKEMLEELDDGHVGLYPTQEIMQAYDKFTTNKSKKTTSTKGKSLSVNIDKVLKKLRKHYVKKIQSYNVDMAFWGQINKDLAFVQLNGMVGWADYKIPSIYPASMFNKRYEKAANKSLNPQADELNGVKTAMNKIMSDLKKSKAVILDLRFNGGGHDEVALELLSYFTEKPVEVFSKKAFKKPGFTQPNVITIQPAEEVFKGKVYILTSHFTASAAEIFMMSALKAIPNVVIIGSNTEGIFSDILEKKLPNGWFYGLSNEVYLSTEGTNYENIGISPHHEIEYDKSLFWFIYYLKDLSKGDAAVEKVLELMEAGKQAP